jgi:hypothetical protein
MKQHTIDLLIAAIDSCLIEPKGDPNRCSLMPAAIIVKALRDEGVKFDLRGFYNQIKSQNLYKHDFYAEAEETYGKLPDKKRRKACSVL